MDILITPRMNLIVHADAVLRRYISLQVYASHHFCMRTDETDDTHTDGARGWSLASVNDAIRTVERVNVGFTVRMSSG